MSVLLKNGFRLISIFLLLSSPLQNSAREIPRLKSTAWELIKQDEGIKILERWVYLKEDFKVRERTGTMTLDCSAEEILTILRESKDIPKWMVNVENVELIKRTSEIEWYVHTVFDTPWPFDQQDMVAQYELRQQDPNITFLTVTSRSELLPQKEDVTRLKDYHAEWVIEKIANNKIKVSFTTLCERAPEYPYWMQDPVVRKVFFNNLSNLRALVCET